MGMNLLKLFWFAINKLKWIQMNSLEVVINLRFSISYSFLSYVPLQLLLQSNSQIPPLQFHWINFCFKQFASYSYIFSVQFAYILDSIIYQGFFFPFYITFYKTHLSHQMKIISDKKNHLKNNNKTVYAKCIKIMLTLCHFNNLAR